MNDLSTLIIHRSDSEKRTGTLFEQNLYDYLRQYAANPDKTQWCIDEELDTHEGTDFIIDGIRIDATSNFANKDNTPFIFDTNIPATRFQNFQMGIRIANTHHGYTEFPEPVVVIGVDMDRHTYNTWDNVIIENIQKYGPNIMSAAQSALDDYTLTDMCDREGLDQPLRPNPNYTPDKKLSPKYMTLNNFQNTIMNDKEDCDFGTY